LEDFLAALAAAFGDRVRYQEPLARHTTLRLGGPAEVWLPVHSVAELVKGVTLARQHKVPLFILGGGANLLISDAGIRGLVIQNRANRVKFPPAAVSEKAGPVTLAAASGVVLPGLVHRCARQGLSGLEWAGGVPGTLGGAIVNNAGAYGQDIASNLIRAELLSPTSERVWRPGSWFEYGYRTSKLKRQSGSGSEWIVLGAELRLVPAPIAEIETKMQRFSEQRKASQPPGATIGSMFKNPPGDYAGRLIEAAGLKGYQVGQAQISKVHANFFQNLRGGATATEVLELIKMARTVVKDRFGVELELEIEIVGEFE
jgi:UDP-N-acetylmuramate dehydrogenase